MKIIKFGDRIYVILAEREDKPENPIEIANAFIKQNSTKEKHLAFCYLSNYGLKEKSGLTSYFKGWLIVESPVESNSVPCFFLLDSKNSINSLDDSIKNLATFLSENPEKKVLYIEHINILARGDWPEHSWVIQWG